MAIEMTFKKLQKTADNSRFLFDECYGIKCYTAVVHKEVAFQYFTERNATPFGEAKWFNDFSKSEQCEVVRAFVLDGSLYVCRELGDETTVYNYSAGSSILLTEAFMIVNGHHKVTRL